MMLNGTNLTGTNATIAASTALGVNNVGGPSSVTINTGGILVLDNTTTNVNNRLGIAAPVVINNGTFTFIGNASTPSTQIVGTIGLGNGTTDYIQLVNNGGTTNPDELISEGGIIRNPGQGATVSFIGVGADLGTAATTGNELRLLTSPAFLGAAGTVTPNGTGILPYGIVYGPAGMDLATDSNNFNLNGVWSVGRVTTYASSVNLSSVSTPLNVKETSGTDIQSTTNIVNGILLAGGTLDLANNALSVQGVVASTGAAGSTIQSTQGGGFGNLFFGALEPLFVTGGANQTQQVSLTGATSGTFTIAFSANPENDNYNSPTTFLSAPLPFNATAAQVQAAIAAMPNVGINNVVVTSPSAGVFNITFVNALGGGNLPLVQVNNQLNTVRHDRRGHHHRGRWDNKHRRQHLRFRRRAKEGLGTLVLTGPSTFTGNFTADQGIVNIQNNTALGATNGTVTVNPGAELQLQGQLNMNNKPLGFAGVGFLGNNAGAIHMLASGGKTATWGFGGTTAITANAAGSATDLITVDSAADTLNLSGTITFNQNTVINQARTLTKTTNSQPKGNVILSGSGVNNGGGGSLTNDYGTTTLDKGGTGFISAPNAVIVGNNDGGVGAATVVYATGTGISTKQIGAASAITINRSGIFNAAGVSDTTTGTVTIIDGSFVTNGGNFTVGGLAMTGGSLATGTGTLTLTGNVTYNYGAQSVISGVLNLGTAGRTFTVVDGVATDDMVINAQIIGGTGSAVIKAGNGALELTNAANSYTGQNNVQTINIAGVGGTLTGTFALQFDGATTAPITYSNTSSVLIANIANALAALPTVGGGAVTTGSGTAGNSNFTVGNYTVAGTLVTVTVTWTGQLGGAQNAPMTVPVSALTGGTSPAVTVTNTTAGQNATALNAGILDLASGNVLGSGDLVLNGGTLWSQGTNITIPNTLQIGNTNSIGGRREYGGTGNITFSNTINSGIFANATINVDDPASLITIAGELGTQAGALTLTKTGNGQLNLAGNNQYTGSTTINGGILDIQNSNALGQGVTTVFVADSGTTNTTPAALYIDGTTANGPVNVTNKVLKLQGLNNNASGTTGYLNNFLGSVYNVGGNNSFTAPYTVVPVAGEVTPGAVLDLFNNVANNNNPTGAINVFLGANAGSSLDFVGQIVNMFNNTIAQASAILTKVGGGTIRTSGTGMNQLSAVTNILQGTLEVNKTPGVDAFRGGIVVGDNASTGALAATLKLDGAQQLTDLGNNNGLQVNSTGTFDSSGQLVTVNEQQTIWLGNANAGTFTLTFAGQTTSALPFNATPAQVQAALQALSSIGTGNVTVVNPAIPDFTSTTGLTSSNGLYLATFTGALAGRNLNQLTINSSLTIPAGGTPNYNFAEVGTIQDGAGANTGNNVQFVSTGGATGGTFTLTYNGQTTNPIAAGATPAQVQSALAALTFIGTGNVAVSAGPAGTSGTYTVVFQGTLAGAAQPALTITSSLSGATTTINTGILAPGGGWDTNQQPNSGLTTGTYTLTVNGSSPITVPFNASAQQLQSLLESVVGQGNVIVTETTTAGVYDVTFQGVYAGTNVPLMVIGAGANVVTSIGADASQTELVNTGGATSGNFTLSYNGQTTTSLPFNATSQQVATALTSLNNLGPAAVNTVQQLQFNSGTTGGTFTLTYNGVTTGNINFNTTPLTLSQNVATALAALGTIGGGAVTLQNATTYGNNNILVSGTTVSGTPYINIQFTGSLGTTPQTLVSVAGTAARRQPDRHPGDSHCRNGIEHHRAKPLGGPVLCPVHRHPGRRRRRPDHH